MLYNSDFPILNFKMTKRFKNIYSNAFNFLHKGPKLIRNTNKTGITLSNFRELRKDSTADTAN